MHHDRGLLKRYEAGERDFSGTDLSGIKLYGSQGREIDLSGADFSNANLENARLSYVDLSGADFSNANLENARLNHVDLNDANFSDANLRNTRIRGKVHNADFSRANLTNAHLSSGLHGTKFREANLTNADFGINFTNFGSSRNDLSNTNLDFSDADCTNTKLTCDLREANFQGANVKSAVFRTNRSRYSANLSRANVSNLDLRGQDFSKLEMSGVNLSGSNLADANLRSANLEGANLRSANLEGADLTCANLRNTQIEGALALEPKIFFIWQIINQGAENKILPGADLSGAHLKDVRFSGLNLSGLNLSGVNFQETNLIGANFSHANLTGANLSYANLGLANLSHVNLTGANLQNASLSSANLESANLTQAKLGRANLSGALLNQANLNQAYLFGVDLEQATLQNATLQNANLTDANLEGADFTGADLSDADLTGAELFQTNLTNVINPSGSASIFFNTPSNPNLTLLNQIREACEGFFYPSEADYPYEVFLWETVNRGEFTLEGLLKACGHLREISADAFCKYNLDDLEWLQPLANDVIAFIEEQDEIQEFRSLLTQVETYLTNIQVLLLKTIYEVYIILANTPSGDWLGISTQVSEDFLQGHYGASRIFRVKDLAIAKPENYELIVALENSIIGMQPPLKTIVNNTNIGYRDTSGDVSNFVWEIAEQRRALIHNLLHTLKIMTTNEVEAVFFNRYEKDKNRQDKANFLVLENLSNLRLYRIKKDIIYMLYFVGQTEDGDWICIQTKAIET
ncbi:pentapeptide repeat-containing protein [Coleofasciculus sp. E2-BRE-01]|uniref:pentapeptide repeat-containing protein n=1 Tax=Coleofasciculus sp. E2-BRE-01 TaxID=3069524 RepID=UPI0032F80791